MASTQLILLTPTLKNGVAYTGPGQIAVDVADITCPITIVSLGGGGSPALSLVTVRKEWYQNRLGDNVNVDVWTVSHSLTAIAAMCFDLQKITVTKVLLSPFSVGSGLPAQPYTPVAMVFFLPNIVGPVEDDSTGCHFFYHEDGNPNPVKYHTTISAATLVGAALPVGGVQSVNGDVGPAVTLTVANTGPTGTLQWVGTQLQIPEADSNTTGLLNFNDFNAFSTGSSGTTSVTYAQMLALTVAGTVVKTRYLITDRGDEGIIVLGTTATTVSVEAIGLFLNADYQVIGDYTGVVPAFNSQLGIWNTGLAPAVGDVVIWNNDHYVNISGANSVSDPTTDPATWTLLSKTRTTGFVPVSDPVLYDFVNDIITWRKESLGNEVFGNTDFFPWGNNNAVNNTLELYNTATDCRNMRGLMKGNIISTDSNSGGGTILFTDFTGTLLDLRFSSPTYVSTSLDLTNCAGILKSCEFTNGCTTTAAMNNLKKLQSVKVTLPVTIVFDPTVDLTNKTCEDGFSDLTATVNIEQFNNFITINYNNLLNGPIQVNDVVTDIITGATGTVLALGNGVSSILVQVTSAIGLSFNTTNGMTFSISGATADVNGTPIVTTVIDYNTLVGAGFVVTHLITDVVTTKTGTCVFDDGVGILGLNQLNGIFANTDGLLDTNGTTATITNSPVYPSVDVSAVDYAGLVTIFSTSSVDTIERIDGANPLFRTEFLSNATMNFVDIATAGNGNIHLDINDVVSGFAFIQTADDFIEMQPKANEIYYYHRVNY